MMFYESGRINSVSALIPNKDGDILLLRRSDDKKSNPGGWELPGGKMEQADLRGMAGITRRALDTTLRREVFEETGLVARRVGHFYQVERRPLWESSNNPLTRWDSNNVFVNYGAVISVEPGLVRLPEDSPEHSEFDWFTPDQLLPRNITVASACMINLFVTNHCKTE